MSLPRWTPQTSPPDLREQLDALPGPDETVEVPVPAAKFDIPADDAAAQEDPEVDTGIDAIDDLAEDVEEFVDAAEEAVEAVEATVSRITRLWKRLGRIIPGVNPESGAWAMLLAPIVVLALVYAGITLERAGLPIIDAIPTYAAETTPDDVLDDIEVPATTTPTQGPTTTEVGVDELLDLIGQNDPTGGVENPNDPGVDAPPAQ